MLAIVEYLGINSFAQVGCEKWLADVRSLFANELNEELRLLPQGLNNYNIIHYNIAVNKAPQVPFAHLSMHLYV